MDPLSIAIMLFIGLRILWANWIKPMLDGRHLKMLRGYHMGKYFILPSTRPNPDGSYYCLIAEHSPSTKIAALFGGRKEKAKFDGWWWEPFLVKAYLHELRNPGSIPSLHYVELADYAAHLEKQNKIKNLQEVL